MSASNDTSVVEELTSEPLRQAGSELQIDADRSGLGVAALVGAAALVPLLAFGVATTLGMNPGIDSDNGGIGSPLSREEVKMTLQRQEEASKRGLGNDEDDTERRLSFEEAAEEQALVDILRGGINRAR